MQLLVRLRNVEILYEETPKAILAYLNYDQKPRPAIVAYKTTGVVRTLSHHPVVPYLPVLHPAFVEKLPRPARKECGVEVVAEYDPSTPHKYYVNVSATVEAVEKYTRYKIRVPFDTISASKTTSPLKLHSLLSTKDPDEFAKKAIRLADYPRVLKSTSIPFSIESPRSLVTSNGRDVVRYDKKKGLYFVSLAYSPDRIVVSDSLLSLLPSLKEHIAATKKEVSA